METSGLGGTRVLGYGQQGAGQSAVQLLAQRVAGFGPQAPQPQDRGQGPKTTASAVVAELMLDRRASQLFLQSIDGWLSGGAQVPYQPPLPLPPEQARQLQQRLAALAQQNSPYLASPDLQTATAPRLLPGAGVVTRTPGRDLLAKQLLDRSTLARRRQGFGKAVGTITPPKAVQAACKRGLELAPEHGGEGLTDAAVARARKMAAGEPVSLPTMKRIKNFHSRHGGYEKTADPPSPGYVAQQLWGGEAGQAWAEAHADGEDDMAQKAEAKWQSKGYVGPGGAWATAKRKAKEAGKDDAYASAIYRRMVGKSMSAHSLLVRHLAKAGGGSGSRGGHIIGTTRSGRPIYASSHETYKPMHQAVSDAGSTHEEDAAAAYHAHSAHRGWSRADHLDAAEAHSAHSYQLGRGTERTQANIASMGHANASRHVDKILVGDDGEHFAKETKKSAAPAAPGTALSVLSRLHKSAGRCTGARG